MVQFALGLIVEFFFWITGFLPRAYSMFDIWQLLFNPSPVKTSSPWSTVPSQPPTKEQNWQSFVAFTISEHYKNSRKCIIITYGLKSKFWYICNYLSFIHHVFSMFLLPPIPSSYILFLLSLHLSVHKGLLQQDSAESKWNRTQWGDPDPHVLSHCVCLRYWRSAGLPHCGHAGHSLRQVKHLFSQIVQDRIPDSRPVVQLVPWPLSLTLSR